MKRSEMQKHISDVIEAHQEDLTEKEVNELSKNLLDRIIALGMKAPDTPFWYRRPDGGIMPHSKNGDMVNEWDKE